MRGFRVPALLLIPTMLIGAAVYDERERPAPDMSTAIVNAGVPVANAASAPASTWYCAAAALSDLDLVVVINLTQEPREGQVTMYPVVVDSRLAPAEPVVAPITLEAGQRLELVPREFMAGDDPVSAVVEFDGGGVLVEHVSNDVDLELGAVDRSPCESAGAASWYFPIGATAGDASMELVLFNPFPEDAVVDLTYFTDAGGRNPSAYEALVIPGRSARLLHIDDEVADRAQASGFLEARSGRLVVERSFRFDGSMDRQGLSVSQGGSVATQVAFFPVGAATPGRVTTLSIANPSESIAEVNIDVLVDSDRVIEPFERRIRPGQSVQLVFGGDGPDAIDLPDVDDYSIAVRSQNGTPIVAERFEVVGATDGMSSSIGSPVAATVWAVDFGLSDPSKSSMTIMNPIAETIVMAKITRLDGTVVAEIELGRGGRTVVSMDGILDQRATLLVEASTPVVVERELVGITSRSTAMGVPLAGSVARIE